MTAPPRRPPRAGNRFRRPQAPKKRALVLRPGADARLRKLFSEIGTPESQRFVPDAFQEEALAVIREADCLVTAPTGAGKTWIALQAIDEVFRTGGRAWYATPLKALSNAKMAEFSEYFGATHVGILTGDRKENPDAPIIVGTTEILRNQLYDAMHRGETLATDFVVLDEAHYLGDEERGVVWEETMIYLPQRIPLLMLSATVGNDQEIADWLSSIRSRPCRVVRETRRPVPLFPIFLHPTGTLLPLTIRAGGHGKPRLYKKVNDFLTARNQPRLAPPGQLPPFGALLQVLRKYHLLPAIFFLKSRADCDQAIQLCTGNLLRDQQKAQVLNERISQLVDRYPHIRQHRQRWFLEHLAVGSHHSGQLPAWKQVLETLMSEGLLDAIFATSTVAAGVDFPARTVAFLNSDRFNGREFMPLDTTELLQMTGRAGRRGKDKVGFALVVPGKYMDVRQVARLLHGEPGPVYSQIRINFSMTLNLLLSHTPEEVRELLHRSLAAFQRQGERLGGRDAAHTHLWHDFQRHLEFLQSTGFVDPAHRLTEDGLWASQLRIDQPLLVAECLRQSLFPPKNPAILAGVMAGFVNEKETDEYLDPAILPKALLHAMDRVVRGLRGFAKFMQSRNFEVRPIYTKPAVTMWAWAAGRPWDKVIEISQMTEGDFAMLVLRTADHLRHLAGLTEVFPHTARAAREAVDMILRDPVIPDRPVIPTDEPPPEVLNS